MIKYKAMIWIVMFAGLIGLPFPSWFLMSQFLDNGNYENRTLAEKPELTIENLETYPRNYEEYFNDRVPYRNQLIRLMNSIDYFLFHQSTSEQVAIGKDGWLFWSNENDGNPIEQSLGYWKFTEEQLQTIANNLMASKQVLEKEGIEFVLFIAPNKETIYQDKLPDYYTQKEKESSVDQLVSYLRKNTDIRVVYPKEELLQERKTNPERLLYHKLDTHWNNAGGYIGAKSLAQELGIEMPELESVHLDKMITSRGDLTDALNISIPNGNVDYLISGISELVTENEKWDFATELIYHTPGADSRNLVVCRDSYSTALAPSLATQFENSYFIHKNSFDQQMIAQYNADIFVLQTVERYITMLETFQITTLA